MKRCLHLAGLLSLLVLTGCSVDIGAGSQFAGQQCFQESDCAVGLTCVDRVCTPRVGSGGPDDPTNSANSDDPDGGVTDLPAPFDTGPQPPPPIDGGPDPEECRAGTRRCVSDLTYEVCVDVGGRNEFRREECSDGEVCDEGRCVEATMCRDADGDGFGVGCERGPDCDDDNPDVYPGRPESCDTPYDDNCNGGVNEGCNVDECCPDGCDGDSQFCSTDCICEPYDPAVCQSQNQPCQNEGDFTNGFVCISFDGQAEPRCWGVCEVNAADPDATCPDPNTVCAFGGGDGENGLCMSTCNIDSATGERTGCPEEADLGCLAVDVSFGDGICAPINPDNERDDFCDAQSFFDCDEGLVCLNMQGGPRGRCREACRPFVWDGASTDCDAGHCLPFSESFGVCFDDNMSTEGESCSPVGSACGEDAVGCYPGGQGGQSSCLRICRLDEGTLDCVQAGQNCNQFDPDQEELGVCF